MKYNKEFFKSHYGSLYNKLIIFQLFFLLITFAFSLSKNYWLVTLFGLIFCIELISVPLTFCYYVRAKKQSERQKQWIEDGKLYVERVFDNGLTAGGFVNHKETVIFNHIESIKLTNYHIIITGNIEIISDYNSTIKNKRKTIYKIPRNFIQENLIIQLKKY